MLPAPDGPEPKPEPEPEPESGIVDGPHPPQIFLSILESASSVLSPSLSLSES